MTAALLAGLAGLAAGATVVVGAWALGILAGGPVIASGAQRQPRRRPPAGHPGRGARARTVRRRHPASIVVWAAVVGGAAVYALGPVTAVVAVGVVGGWRGRLVIARRRRSQRAVEAAVPDLIDLLRVAVAAGQSVPVALRSVAERAPPTIRRGVVQAVRRLDQGSAVADALAQLSPALGSYGTALCDVLMTAHRTGAAASPALDRLAATARDARRRRAEADARRLPVLLLIPLIACVLPAFGLLAVVPLLTAALADLRL